MPVTSRRYYNKRVNRVLFVCTANICRSPMAQEIFNAFAEDKGLSLRAESAGVAALKGEPMAPNAVAALSEVGIYPEVHRARQVNEKMIREHDLVLTMSPWHAAKLRQLYGDLEKIQTLPEYASNAPKEEDVPDPYGSALVAYRASVRLLFGYVEALLARLESSR